MAAFVAVQLGAADARGDVGAVVDRRDPVVVAVANQGRAGDRAEPVPHVMACPRLELGRAGGHGGRVLLILPGGRGIGHGVQVRHRGAVAKAAVIPRQQIEAGSEGIKQWPDVLQGQSRPVAEQQPGTIAPLLPIQLGLLPGAVF